MCDSGLHEQRRGGCGQRTRHGPASKVRGRWRWHLALLLAMAGAIVRGLGAEPPEREYLQRVFRKEQGLPDNQVNAILQDGSGYLWIATRRGLARFDGSRFVTFDHLNTPAMDNDDCRALAQDPNGRLWVLTATRVLRRDQRGFVRFEYAAPDFTNLLPPFRVTSDQGVWLRKDHYLARVTPERMEPYRRGLPTPLAIEEDPSGAVWVATTEGFFRGEPREGRFDAVDSAFGARRPPVIGLCPSRQGGYWVLFANYDPSFGLHGTNAWLQHYRGGQWNRPSLPEAPDFQYDHRACFVLEDAQGAVWLPALFNGLNRFRQGRFEFVPMPHSGQYEHALCVHEDREGNLWVGTETDGLQRWEPRRARSWTVQDGLPHDNCWTAIEARDGSVWIGTDGGVSRYHEGRFANLGEAQGLSRNTVRALAEDREGTIWIGTGGGLDAWRDGRISRIRFPGEWVEGKTRTLLAARDGVLWVGTAVGLQRLQANVWTKFTVANGLPTNDVRALLEDRTGRLWVGTAGGGLTRFEDGVFSTLTTADGLGSDFVWALHEDADGGLWIGTENGLSRLAGGRITTFSTRVGLPVNLVNHILEDEAGRLWISHDGGVYRVHRRELEAVAAGRADRVDAVVYAETQEDAAIETNGQKSQPAGCRTQDGRLWFPTTRGLLVFDPGLHRQEGCRPQVVIEQVRANGRIVYDNGPVDLLESAPGREGAVASTMLEIAPGGARVLEFHYTATTLVAAEKTRFRHRLLGLAEHWIEAGTRREAYFTDLRPGRYRFELMAADRHGVWGEAAPGFTFHVAAFWHQTWAFRAGCAGLVLVTTYGVYRWRVRELRHLQRLEQQAALANERARIAKDLHDGLGADLTHLTMLAEAVGDSLPRPGAGESQVGSLSEASRRVVRSLKEVIWATDPADVSVEGTVSHLCQYTESYLEPARIQCRLDLGQTLPTSPLSAAQRRALLFVVKEALHNVTKHANATEVTLSARATDGWLSLAIADNGRGFALGSLGVNGTGRGLRSLRQRIEGLGGRFEISSTVGQGTALRLELPLTGDAGEAGTG